eukprot:GDKJ01014455.1.p3 GENE.GDKJ01014455.1~~GDKJ01014455.1.p3  ORF type:complete len:101 (+),score=8.25 GDKJ01014455.1:928-1230(+)
MLATGWRLCKQTMENQKQNSSAFVVITCLYLQYLGTFMFLITFFFFSLSFRLVQSETNCFLLMFFFPLPTLFNLRSFVAFSTLTVNVDVIIFSVFFNFAL